MANDKDDDDNDDDDDRNDDESSDEENKPLTRGEFNQKLLSALNDSIIASSNASKEFYAISTRNQLQNNTLLANLLTKMDGQAYSWPHRPVRSTTSPSSSSNSSLTSFNSAHPAAAVTCLNQNGVNGLNQLASVNETLGDNGDNQLDSVNETLGGNGDNQLATVNETLGGNQDRLIDDLGQDGNAVIQHVHESSERRSRRLDFGYLSFRQSIESKLRNLVPLQYQDLNFVAMRGMDGMARVLDQIDRNKNLSK